MTCDCAAWPLAKWLCEPVAEGKATNPSPALAVPSYREAGGDMRRAAVHEAGHAISALAFGRIIFAVSIDPQPIALSFDERPSLIGDLVCLLAGEICEGRWRGRVKIPRKDEMIDRIDAAIKDEAGLCDLCKQAKALVAFRPNLDNETLCELWLLTLQITAELFRHDEFRRAHERLVSELLTKNTLDGAQVGEILDAQSLALAKEAVLTGWDLGALGELEKSK